MTASARSACPRPGGRLLVDALAAHGVDRVFTVAGESYLHVLDALVDRPEIQVVTCRQEGGAAFMAEAHGKLTGRPGVCFVTRGPGACNGSIGVHTAMQDSTPMIYFIGQVARDQAEREAFQEIDYRRMFGAVAKWAAQIDDPARVPEFVSRAFHVAASGRPGPVVLALPEDMLAEAADVADAGVTAPTLPHPGPADLDRLAVLLAAAERPLVLAGGSGWTDAAAGDLRRFAEAWRLPVAVSFRRQDVIDNRSPSYAGDLGTGANPALVARVKACDLLIVLGARLGEITTQGYAMLDLPVPRQTLVHLHPSAEEIGRVFHPTLGVQAAQAPAAAALAALAPPAACRWTAWADAAAADYAAWVAPQTYGGDLDLGRCFAWLADRLPDDAIVTVDAGNFSGWSHRFLRYRRPGRQLGPTSGAMGYAVPAAVSASLAHPDRIVVANVGDGGFQMTGQELATAMHHGAKPVILLFDNGMYGTIRMHQEREYPARVSATTLTNPDFAALARSYGAFGATVARTEDFAPAFEAALASGTAAVLHLKMDPEQITTRTTLAEVRAKALAAKG
jgi:acetolactate synthase-1/2/3 large subunit